MLIGANFITGYTNLGRQVAEATKFRWVPPNICGNLLHVTLLTPRILR